LRLSFAAGTDLSLKIYRRTLYQPYAVHISRNSSEIINGITIKNSEVIFYIISPALTLVSSIIVLIAIIATLLSVVPMVAFVAFGIFAAIYGLIIRLTRNRLKADSENIARESTNVIKILQEGLGGIRDVLLDGTQETFCAIYSNADQILRRAQSNNLFISQSPRFGMEAMAILLISLLAYILTRQSANVAGSFPVLAALALGMQRLLPYSQQAYGSWTTIRGAEASLRDVLLLLDQPLPEYADQAAPLDPMPFSREIVLKQLSFRYGPQSSWVLQDIHLAIPRGSRVGFIGATGCGKSTLLDLIMGLLQPTAGTIEIDGTVITPDNLRMWQSHIAHVPQAIFLTDSSIEENIAFGVPWHLIDHDRVRNAAAQAQIADIIESWPNQYQTVVGERGVQISGGQRQRIGIARALYKNADVIIFDESTSALDSETEQAVMRAIDSLSDELTVLIIAHRLSTLKNCSHIVELAHGSIVLREN
jgi:ATP-binding cassette subfamily B protein